MNLVPRLHLGALARKLIIQFHNYPLSMSFLYRDLHTRLFMSKAVSDNAIFFWDYDEYARHNAEIFDKYVLELGIEKSRALCLEFGVRSGVSINLLSGALPEYRVIGFDSFDGFVSVKTESTWFEYQKKFWQQTIPKVNSNVELIKGYVENTLPEFVKGKFNSIDVLFVHLDMDIYEPTKVVLDWIAKTDKKAFIMFDELINYSEFHLHEYRAFLETIVENKIPYRIRTMCDRGSEDYGQFGKVFVEVR
jgi:hypothetical protein